MENLISSSVIDSGSAEVLANAYIKWKYLDFWFFCWFSLIVIIVLFLLNR